MEPQTTREALQIVRDPAPDHTALAALMTAAHPDKPHSAEELRRRDTVFLKDSFHAVWTVEKQGELVGLADVSADLSHAGWGRVALYARPESDTEGLRTTLWHQVLLGLQEMKAHTALAHASETWWELAFLKAQGFVEHDRMWLSTLDLSTFDPAPFGKYLERARSANIEILPLSHFPWQQEATQRRLYALMADLLADIPAATPFNPWPFEQWRERVLDSPDFDPDGLYLALQGEDWVGLTELNRPDHARPGTVHQGLTGVRRAWRGHGIAWALKLRAAQDARARGFRAARTMNQQVNRAMLGINEAMGYVKEPAWIELKKTL